MCCDDRPFRGRVTFSSYNRHREVEVRIKCPNMIVWEFSIAVRVYRLGSFSVKVFILGAYCGGSPWWWSSKSEIWNLRVGEEIRAGSRLYVTVRWSSDFKVWTSTVVWTSRVRSLRSQLADASVRELPFCPRIVGFGIVGWSHRRATNFLSPYLSHTRQ